MNINISELDAKLKSNKLKALIKILKINDF